MRLICLYSLLILFVASSALAGYGVSENKLKVSQFDLELQRIRYDQALSPAGIASIGQEVRQSERFTTDNMALNNRVTSGRKSPGKAFLLSFAIPGAGQYYYGSRVKSLGFLGVDVASWVMKFKFDGQGDDITADFEETNRQHWSRERYEDYLEWVYGSRSDHEIDSAEVSHHLPDTRTQQYYEMTGKYDQFVWGWSDATAPDGSTFSDYNDTTAMDRVLPGQLPKSTIRTKYINDRYEADIKYNRASKMVIVSMVNHLFSAFEAYFTVRKMNKKLDKEEDDSVFSRVSLEAQMRSIHEKQDTPFLRVTYKF